jgi:hypothetical protein
MIVPEIQPARKSGRTDFAHRSLQARNGVVEGLNNRPRVVISQSYDCRTY